MSIVQSSVALAVAVHEPNDRLVALAEAELPALRSRYAAVIAFCSQETHPALRSALERSGAALRIDDDPALGIDSVGRVRRRTVEAALLTGTSHVHLCDFDRALHWSARYPAEMAAVAVDVARHDMLILGRTARAWASHPPYQTETEALFNKVFALATGLPWDIGAGSRGLSRRAAGAVLATAHDPTVGTDAEWPLLLLGRTGFCLGHRRCEGLEFETADSFAPEIEQAGSYQAWEAAMSADPRRWVFRLRVALLIAEAATRHGPPWPSHPDPAWRAV